jgi:hypothetical protein
VNLRRRSLPTVILAAVVLAVVAAGSSTAAVLITSANIKDHTIKPIDLSNEARTAIKGAPCTIPGHGTGKIQVQTLSDGRILFGCKNAYTTDNDGDDFTEAQGDCNDADDAINPGALELFDGKDNDCDGLLYSEAFYDGPGGTEGVGICHAGIKDETANPPYSFISQPQQLPQQEVGGDGLDNDCDGVVDEG